MNGRRYIAVILLFLGFGALANDFDPWKDSARYKIEYVVDLSVLPKDQPVNLWIPQPVNDHHQTVLSQQLNPKHQNWVQTEITDNRGNKVIQLSLPVDTKRIDKLQLQYVIHRDPSTGTNLGELEAKDNPNNFMASAIKIPLDGLIASIAVAEKGAATSDKSLQRRYYNYVYDSMTYSKEGEGWGEGDAIWACQSKYGNCTDFHSLYIGLVRSQQIAARFKIGFPLSAKSSSGRHDGYHCWAETFDVDDGWFPLDASEAKKAGLREEYYGTLPSDRVEFTQGRDIVLSELQRGEPINYFIYPYAETPTDIINRLPVKMTYQRLEQFQLSSTALSP